MTNSPRGTPTQELSPVKQALLALKSMKAQLAEAEARFKEPIAIVGIACRFPGDSDTPDRYWQTLMSGKDAIRPRPVGRWQDAVADAYLHSLEARQIEALRYGGYLERIDTFDPAFFGMSVRECRSVDPQQRLLLELSYEALENGAFPVDKLAGERVGSFIAIGNNDYGIGMLGSHLDPYVGTGISVTAGSGRINHTFGFTGPAISIDTACSSTLVTIHLAAHSLRQRESDIALAGGVNLVMTPISSVNMTMLNALAPDGRCKTFAANADGYGRGEGAGMVVLKRLGDARADGDRILAILHGSAVNHDGRSSGLTVPNQRSQEAVIRAALEAADLRPEDISYIEAHGTGTPLGDPIEMSALNNVYGKNRQTQLYLGSVKTNVGHLELAAGIAGVTKLVLALQQQQLPPHLNLDEPNPMIPWAQIPFAVTTRATSWTDSTRPLLAGISGFGFTGTNAHLIIGAGDDRSEVVRNNPYEIVTISARSEPAVQQLVHQYNTHLTEYNNLELGDIARSLNTGRSHYANRLAIQASSTSDLQAALQNLMTNQPGGQVMQGKAGSEKLAFLFTGQGAQFAHMGRQLYEQEPTFKATVDRCADILDDYLTRPLLAVLFPNDEAENQLIDQTEFTQPALFVLAYALAQLLLDWGVTPSTFIGHSVGELAAACVANVFSLADGLRLIAARGRLMGQLPDGGSMAAILTDLESVALAVQPYQDDIAIAAHNGPHHVVISGRSRAVEKLVAQFQAQGVRAVPLTVSHAFHSALMEPMLAEFRSIAAQIKYQSPDYWIISNVTGKIAGPEIATADYWVNHVRATVLFQESLAAAAEQGCTVFVEIGPKPTLTGMGRRCLPDKSLTWLAALHDKRADLDQLTRTVASLYVRGVDIAWPKLNKGRKIALPTYPFQRQSYWFKASTEFEMPGGQASHFLGKTNITLLGRERLSPGQERQFEASWAEDSLPIEDGLVDAGWILAVGLAAAREAGFAGLADVTFPTPLSAAPAGPTHIHTTLSPDNRVLIATYNAHNEHWLTHLDGSLTNTEMPTASLADIKGRCSRSRREPIPMQSGKDEFLLRTPATPHGLPAKILEDAAACAYAVLGLSQTRTDLKLLSIGAIRHLGKEQITWLYGSVQPEQSGFRVDLLGFAEDGTVVASCRDITISWDLAMRADDWLYKLSWHAFPRPMSSQMAADWLLVSNEATLISALAERGQRTWTPAQTNLKGLRRWVEEMPADFGTQAPLNLVFHWRFKTADHDTEPVTTLLHLFNTCRLLDIDHFYLIVNGATAANTRVYPAAAMLWGLVGTAATEFPSWKMRRIDVAAAADSQILIDLLATSSLPAMLYASPSDLKAPQLETLVAPAAGQPGIAADKTYLITGGLGSLGWSFAAWLIKKGAQSIVLTSRSYPNPDALAQIQAWRQSGVDVNHVPCDISERSQVASLFSDIDKLPTPLGGILHAAGLEDNDLLLNQNAARLQAVLDPKVRGSWLLHEASAAIPLDFFVCFSSAAALLGTPGLATYAAANAYQDALCHYRRQHGMAALSINWGPWAGAGMAGQLDENIWQDLGVAMIPRAVGLDIFGRLLTVDTAQAAVLTFDRNRLSERFLPSLSGGRHRKRQISKQLKARLSSLPALDVTERQPVLEGYLQENLAIILDVAVDERVPHDTLLHDLGLDSLMAVELRNRIERDLHVGIRIQDFLENPTINHLAILLNNQIENDQSTLILPGIEPGHGDEGTAALLASLDDLTDAEIDALLRTLSDE